MSRELVIRNRQRAIPVNVRHLHRIALALLDELPHNGSFDLGICLVSATEMARLNKKFLRHQGPTDVVTFDYSDHASHLYGELFICPDEAKTQARRFRTTWQSELVRYIVHGLLHLSGYNDKRAGDRRKMKREEGRLVRELGRRFPFSKLARRPPLP